MAPVLNILTTILSFSVIVQPIIAAPVVRSGVLARQLAGEGAACNSVLSSTDNGVGYGVENAEDNTAGNINNAKGTAGNPPVRRQLAGEGAACNSVLSSTDNGVGYGVENAEDNTAGNIAKVTGATGGTGKPPPPPPPHMFRRQLDKIANGAAAVIDATGVPIAGGVVKGEGDSVDGTLTGTAADTGAKIGDTEAGTLESAGSMIPKL